MGNGVSVVAVETRVRVDPTGSSPPRSTFHANFLTPFGPGGAGGVPLLQNLCLSLQGPRGGPGGLDVGLRQLLSGGGRGREVEAARRPTGADDEDREGDGDTNEDEDEGVITGGSTTLFLLGDESSYAGQTASERNARRMESLAQSLYGVLGRVEARLNERMQRMAPASIVEGLPTKTFRVRPSGEGAPPGSACDEGGDWVYYEQAGEVNATEDTRLGPESLKTGETGAASRPSCYICLTEYEDEDCVRELPCRHRFHPLCVDKWLIEVHKSCPTCRCDATVPRGGGHGGPTLETLGQ